MVINKLVCLFGVSQTMPITDIDHSRKDSDHNEINHMHIHTSQFADSLKDLRNLRKQLYTAAERFESSYDKTDHKQLVVQLSKDYVAKALVSTVYHLGSVADKLSKFLDVKAHEFSATNKTFSCIEQRVRAFEEVIELRSMSQQLLMVEPTSHAKHYTLPASDTSSDGVVLRHCISSPPHNEQQTEKGIQQSRMMMMMMSNTSPSPLPHSFSFTRVLPNKEAEKNKSGKRSISPFRFALSRSGLDGKRSISPSPSVSKTRCSSEPRRATSESRRRQDEDMMNRDKEIETYTSRSKQLFRALISVHRSGK